jgi:hypothetical protein
MLGLSADALVNALIKAIGMEPEKLRAQVVQLQQWTVDSIKGMNARVHAMENDRVLMHEKLNFIAEQNRQILNLLGNQNGRNESAIDAIDSNGLEYFDRDGSIERIEHGANGSGGSGERA